MEALLAVARALVGGDYKLLKPSDQEQSITMGVPSAKLLILLAFVVRDQEVGGSNPLAPANPFNHFPALRQQALRQPQTAHQNPFALLELPMERSR
jgi:hypothetical protein